MSELQQANREELVEGGKTADVRRRAGLSRRGSEMLGLRDKFDSD